MTPYTKRMVSVRLVSGIDQENGRSAWRVELVPNEAAVELGWGHDRSGLFYDWHEAFEEAKERMYDVASHLKEEPPTVRVGVVTTPDVPGHVVVSVPNLEAIQARCELERPWQVESLEHARVLSGDVRRRLVAKYPWLSVL